MVHLFLSRDHLMCHLNQCWLIVNWLRNTFQWKFYFRSRNAFWKFCLQNVRHFVQGPMYKGESIGPQNSAILQYCYMYRVQINITGMQNITNWTYKDHFVYAPSQWETTLQCKVSHWLGAYTKWSLHAHDTCPSLVQPEIFSVTVIQLFFKL